MFIKNDVFCLGGKIKTDDESGLFALPSFFVKTLDM
jgi:hypothetical protein